ncbi:MAG: OsmC family protein [Dysgonamonadaceae bacterium]|nr:OsmC family protein [Dysgonamonadaceae bacterium]
METIKTTYLGNLRTEAIHLQSGSKIITDGPTDNHGKGEAFSPTDLFAASYASCALTIIGIAAQTHGFDINGTVVKTTKVMAEKPRRIAELILEFTFPHAYSEKECKLIEGAIKNCPVANTLPPELKISRTLKFKE